jgi:hypothetical protein
MTTFRTPSGQTGTDAYIYEAAQIRNSLRELDRRAARLAAVMVDELPEDASCLVSIASENYPDATSTADRESLTRILPMLGRAADAELLLDYARGIAHPEHVVENRVR